MQSQKPKLKQRAYQYALHVISFLNTCPKNNTTEVIKKQLLRSATSIGANIIEAQSSSSRKDFANFFNHALKSANESIFWFNLLKDSQNVKGQTIVDLIRETQELANILGASLLTMRGKR